MSENETTPTEAAAPAEKKTRRRLTPEEQIAERQAEIARIKAKQCERVRERIAKVRAWLLVCTEAARTAGMEKEAASCIEASRALSGPDDGPLQET